MGTEQIEHTMHPCDNGDIIIPFNPETAHPVAGTGVTLTDDGSGDQIVSVKAGGTYVFTCSPALWSSNSIADKTFLFGVGDTTVDANIVWVCNSGMSLLIQVPDSYVVLHYRSKTSGSVGYLRRLE